MKIQTIGLGAGGRDLAEQPNLLRLIIGETDDHLLTDEVWILETNVDDISGEVIGHATTKLLEIGALDVYTTAIQMKKNRPGTLITVLCSAELMASVEAILFRETSTLGIRRWPASRHKLERRTHAIQTAWGEIQGKLAVLTDGSLSFSPEFESCKKIAAEKNVPLKDVYELAMRTYGRANS